MTQRVLRLIGLVAIFWASHQSVFSQTISNVNPTINLLDGGAYYIHEVLEGQEIEAIAAAYFAEIPEIIKANPEIRTGLKVGMKLKIPFTDESLAMMSQKEISTSILTEVQPKKIEQKPNRVPATPVLPQKQTPKPANQSPMQEAVSLLDEAMNKPAETTEIESKTEVIQPPMEEFPVETVEENVKEELQVSEDKIVVPETVTKDEILEEESPKAEEPKTLSQPELSDLSERIKESLSTLEMMKKALEVGPTGVPVVELADDADHYFAMDFLEDHLKERFDSDSSMLEFYIKEYFTARIDPNGVIVSLRDERTETNANTQDLNIEEVADLTLYSYPNVQNKLAETALGLNADVKVYQYQLKIKKNGIKVYKESVNAEDLKKDHIHYEMIMEEAAKQGKLGKCEVIIWDGFIYTARYKRVEYNPFAEMTDVIDERRIQRIVKMKFQ